MKCACFKANRRCNSRCHKKGNNPNCKNHDEPLEMDRDFNDFNVPEESSDEEEDESDEEVLEVRKKQKTN